MSPLASLSPSLSARALPPFSSVSSCTRGSPAKAWRTIALVSSFDPSSITITSIRTSLAREHAGPRSRSRALRYRPGSAPRRSGCGSIGGGTARLLGVGSHREDREQDRARVPTKIAVKNRNLSDLVEPRESRKIATSKRTAIRSDPLIFGFTAPGQPRQLRDRHERISLRAQLIDDRGSAAIVCARRRPNRGAARCCPTWHVVAASTARSYCR
jgi:hypothetical protein